MNQSALPCPDTEGSVSNAILRAPSNRRMLNHLTTEPPQSLKHSLNAGKTDPADDLKSSTVASGKSEFHQYHGGIGTFLH